jgi:hypothetical protein
VEVPAVGDAFEWLRCIAETMQPQSSDLFIGGCARGVRGNHLDLMTSSHSSLSDPRDERAGGVPGKPGIVVRDCEYAHLASRYRSR